MVDAGLDPEFVWSLKPRELNRLLARHNRERYRLSAHVCWFFAEAYRNRDSNPVPYTIDDFLPPLEGAAEYDEMPEDPMAFPRAFGMLAANPEHGFEDLTKGVTITYREPDS